MPLTTKEGICETCGSDRNSTPCPDCGSFRVYKPALQQLLAIPVGNYTGFNRYDTDGELVLHVWDKGQSFDIRIPKQSGDAAARVEPRDKWKYTPSLLKDGTADIRLELDQTVLIAVDIPIVKARHIVAAHNASLPATPTPQGQTSEETSDPLEFEIRAITCPKCDPTHSNPDLVRGYKNSLKYLIFESLRCRNCYSFLIDVGDVPGSGVLAWQSPTDTRRETKSGASLGAATDKEERFS